MHAHSRNKHTATSAALLQRRRQNGARYKVPLCVSFAVASNNDASLFEEFISRKSNYFSGILEITQRGSTFSSQVHKHKQTHCGNTACVTAWEGIQSEIILVLYIHLIGISQ